MIKNNPRIKETITKLDEIHAIESIVSSVFITDEATLEVEYKPYYSEFAQVLAIVNYFMEGIDLSIKEDEYDEHEDIYSAIVNDKEIYDLVLRFFYDKRDTKLATKENKENAKYINIMDRVLFHASDMIDFKKKQLANKNENMEYAQYKTMKSLGEIAEYFEVIAKGLSGIANLDLRLLDDKNFKVVQDVLHKVKDSDMTTDTLSDIVSEASLKLIKDRDE